MRRTIMTVALAVLALSGRAVAAPCQTGIASAPYIGATDMRTIDRAAKTLPAATGRIEAEVGSAVPAFVKRAPVPGPVVKVLPQYRGYSAFRTGTDLVIVDPRGILSYIMPLRGSANPANCP